MSSDCLVINSKCLRRIYFSFIHSYISYENIAWDSTWLALIKLNLKKLSGKQKQAAHMMFNQGRFAQVRTLLIPNLGVCRVILSSTPP